MQKIIDLKKFTISVEIIPPKNGRSLDKVYSLLARLHNKIDFVSVTKGAGGSHRAGTLPVSFISQNKYGIPAIAHVVCREHSRHELENEIMDLHYLGIRNVLVIKGDPPATRKEDEPWKGEFKESFKLIAQINAMNEGKFLEREGEPTEFTIMAAGHPEEEDNNIQQKKDAGAEAIITQMVFDIETFKKYKAKVPSIPIIVVEGFMVLIMRLY